MYLAPAVCALPIWLSMVDFPLMFIGVKLPVVDLIYSLSNKYAIGVEIKAPGDSNLNNSPAVVVVSLPVTP